MSSILTRACVAATFLLVVELGGSSPAFSAIALEAPHPTPVNWNLTAAQINTNCAAVIANVDHDVKNLLALHQGRTIDNTLLPLENAAADLNDRLVAETFLQFVSSDQSVRDASAKCNADSSDYVTELSARPELYAALVAVKKSATAKTVYDKKMLALWLTALYRYGAGLNASKRTEFVKLQERLTKDQIAFGQNLGNDTATISVTAEQAATLPSDFVANLKKTADSSYTVAVNESTYVPFMENEKDAAARQKYLLAYSSRQAVANGALLRDAIATRDRLARLLGFHTWAAFVLADHMAANPQRVFGFLNKLDAMLLPRAKANIAELTALKAQDTAVRSPSFERWDLLYYDNMLHKTRYSVDNDAIRQYFPVQHTIDAVLDIYHRMLGITFVRQTQPNVWNKDVLAYDVFDTASGKYIGATYFDLYPRPGKYDHFANFPILPVRRLPDGSWRPPLSAIVGNWPQPAPGHPALLSHDDVVTFFHEFGHNLAALLATAPYETLSSGFRLDFVEAPSQMLENFMWEPAILKEVSSNATTGQPLPDDLIAKLIATRYVNYPLFTTGQIADATVDMQYHTSGPNVDLARIWSRVFSTETPLPMAAGTAPWASFGHLMSGYDAGYYGYLWSKVYAQDMFTAFQRGGLQSPVVGMRYRTTILEPARTIEPDPEVQAFLGRPMNAEAFYKEFSVTPP